MRHGGMYRIAARLGSDLRYLGLLRTGYQIMMKVINLCCDFRIIRVSKRETVHPDFLDDGDRLTWRFLDDRQLAELAAQPDGTLTPSAARAAIARGDECFGAFDGDQLACYAWYSNQPTDDDGLTVQFSPDYVYSYAAVTLPEYRGRRLHPIRMNRVLREYLARGRKGIVSTIDSQNFRALRGAAKLGVEEIGYVVVLKFGNRAWTYASSGCRRHGFSLSMPEPAPPAELAATGSS